MSWHKNNYSYRLPVEINCEYVDSDITGFVLSYKIDGDHHIFSHTRSDGHDIVPTDANGNDLYFERSIWDPTNYKLVLYLKLDITSSYNTKFYIYYDNPNQDSDLQDKHGVWSSYSLVYHLEETSGSAQDSSPHNRSGTIYDTISRNEPGDFGKGYKFYNHNGYVYTDNVVNDISNKWTISLYVKPLEASTRRKGMAGSGWGYHDWYVGVTSNSRFTTWVCHPSSCSYATSSNSFSTNVYYHVLGVYNNNNLKLFVDAEQASEINFSWSRSTSYNRFYLARTHGGGQEYFNCAIDELRVANFSYSNARAKAEGSNFKNYLNFVLTGLPEEPYLLDNAPTLFTVGKVQDESYKLLAVDYTVGSTVGGTEDLDSNFFASSILNLYSGSKNLINGFDVSSISQLKTSFKDSESFFGVGKLLGYDSLSIYSDFYAGRIDTTVTGGSDVYNTFMVGHLVSPSGLGEDVGVNFVVPFSYSTAMDTDVDFTISTSKLFGIVSDLFLSASVASGIDTDSQTRAGLITWYGTDCWLSNKVVSSFLSDVFSSMSGIKYYESDISLQKGLLERYFSDVVLSTQTKKRLNTDTRLLGLVIENFFLDQDEFKPASTVLTVDILDYISTIDTSKSYLTVSGVTVSSTLTPIPHGYRMTYDPVDDFYSTEPLEVTVHVENIIGDKKEQHYYLLYGYNLIYNTLNRWDWDKDIDVVVQADNLAKCKGTAYDAWSFKIESRPTYDLGATIVPLIKTQDLGATIYPQSKAFYYGKYFEFTVFAKDLSGNEMVPFKLKFKIDKI